MDNQRENNSGFYDRISRAYDLIADAGEHRAREAGEDMLAVVTGETVLEIGFGTGNSLIAFAVSAGAAGEVYGIDISDGMQDVAGRKLQDRQLQDHVTLDTGDARQMPYEDGKFDAVFSSFTLELFPLTDIPTVLAEAKRVLKPGGRLGIVSMSTVPSGEQASLLEKTYVWMHQHFPHIVDCQPIDAERSLAEAGFEIGQAKRIDIWTMPVQIVVAKPKH